MTPIATRAGSLCLAAAALICGLLALSSPYQVPLAIAVGWIGYTLHRRSLLEAPAVPTARQASELWSLP
jgi:hypothetical protein